MLKLKVGCVITSNKFTWKYVLGNLTQETLEIERRLMLPNLNITFTRAPIDITVPQLNWTNIEALSDLTGDHIPVISDILEIPHLVLNGNFTIWLILGIILMALMAAAGLFCYLRIRPFLKRRQAARRLAKMASAPPQQDGKEPDQPGQPQVAYMPSYPDGKAVLLYPTLEQQ